MATATAAQTAPEADRFRDLLEAVPDSIFEIDNEAGGGAFEEIVGRSAALKQVLGEVETVAPTNATVLILGETGTGKELIARAIHRMSPRRNLPFITVNCAAFPAGLLESELFGYERGAFTGALSQKIGRFESAHRGTLFLDEVGDIPLDLQPKLLRALQEKTFERLGGTKTIPSGRPDSGGNQPESDPDDGGQTVSQRSLLPVESVSYHDTSVARSPRRYPYTRPAFHPEVRAGNEQAD